MTQKAQLSAEVQFLHTSVFKQVQQCGDIIGSILLICKFVTENRMSVQFEVAKLRQIALRAVDSETSTHLWHVNALIAASADFEHLVLGIEMMFERFLGSSQLFLKEKAKQTAQSDARDTKFLGNEVVSFVNSYYDDTASADDAPDADNAEAKASTPPPDFAQATPEPRTKGIIGLPTASTANSSLTKTPTRGQGGTRHSLNGFNASNIQCGGWLANDENANANVQNTYVASPMGYSYVGAGAGKGGGGGKAEEQLQEYRGKISSPISFRMRQQKRMMQSERGSRCPSVNASFLNGGQAYQEYAGNGSVDAALLDDMHLMETMSRVSLEPEEAAPFDVNKFAECVDQAVEQSFNF